MRRKNYYKRPGIDTFVTGLHNSDHFELAIYSSMAKHNIEAAMNALLDHKSQHAITKILDQTMCKKDPDGDEAWDTIRDMDKVWKAMPKYGPANTILLDNEARKFKEHPRNGIIVPEFGVGEVKSRKTGTLDTLLAYLLELGKEAQEGDCDDVRIYLTNNPFESFSTTATTSAALQVSPLAIPSLDALSVSSDKGAGDDLIPKGTSVNFVCNEGTKMIMKGSFPGGTLKAFVEMKDGWRVEKRIDLDRLKEEAADHGSEVKIETSLT